MPSNPPIPTVAIVGAGPAGCAAAIHAARAALPTVLMTGGGRRTPGCGGWIGPAAIEMLAALGISPPASVVFRGITLHSLDFRHHAVVRDDALHGAIPDGAWPAAPLLDAVRAAGVDLRTGPALRAASLRERDVLLTRDDGGELSASQLIIADGRGSDASRLIGLPPPAAGASAAFCTWEQRSSAASLDVCLGGRRTSITATIARSPNQVRVLLLSRDPEAPAARALASLLGAAASAGVVAPPPSAADAVVEFRVGGALDTETHVAKRCLRIGAAGGFASAFSGDGLHAALCSGRIAAEVLKAAAHAPLPQDELARFDSAWRVELADAMREPRTDLSLLTPMLFSNAQMSARVARAFLLGASI